MKHLSLVAVAIALVLALTPPAFTMWHCGDIDLPSNPQAILLDPISRGFWISLSSADLAYIEEATSHLEIIPMIAPACAMGIDPASRLLYLAHPSSLVTILNTDSRDTSLVSVGQSPVAIAVDGVRGAAYVACDGDSAIYSIQSGAITDTLKCPGSPSAIAVDPKRGTIFASLGDADLLLSFCPSTLDTTYYAVGPDPHSLEIDPVEGKLYIALDSDSLKVLAIDSDSLVSTPICGNAVHLALNPETHHLFVATTSNALCIVNTNSFETLEIALHATPDHLSIDALSDRAFVSLPSPGHVIEVNSAGDTAIVAVSGTPSDLILNPITNKAYVLTSAPSRVSVLEAANYSGTRVAAGGGPGPVVINMETHKVYTPNWYTANVTVIDGYTNGVSNFKVADGPNCLIVDPIADDVYILCAWANKVTIKHPDGDTLTVPIGSYAHGIELNTNTGKVYTANRYSRDMTIIDTKTLDTTLVRTGAYPCDVAINLETNKIYIPNRTSWTLTVVDGALLSTKFPRVGPGPTQVHVNPLTNKIFSVDSNKRTISVIDGVTLERTVVPVGTTPRALSLNLNTNTIYVSSGLDGEITVIDGDTYARRPVRCEQGLFGVRVDPYLDKVYAVSWDYPDAFVIDANFLSALKIPVGEEPHGIAYDPVLEKLYISNHGRNSVEVIKLRDKITPRLIVTIDSLPGDTTSSRTPTLTGTASSLRSPRAYGIMKVLYKIDNLRGPWQEATLMDSGTEVSWTLTTQPLLLGRHLVFVVAIDSSAASLSSSSSASLTSISDIACYEFTCMTPPPSSPKAADMAWIESQPTLAWTSTCGEGGWYELEMARDRQFKSLIDRISNIKSNAHVIDQRLIEGGPVYWRVRAYDYPHGKASALSPAYSLSISGVAVHGDVPLLTAHPNPAPLPLLLSLSGYRGSKAQCEIYDVRGRLIQTLTMLPSGEEFSARWDGKNMAGTHVSPGIYYARLKAGEQVLECQIAIIR